MTAASIISRSASGSATRPNSDSTCQRRASQPSIWSVTPATAEDDGRRPALPPSAGIRSTTKTGISASRRIVSAFGTCASGAETAGADTRSRIERLGSIVAHLLVFRDRHVTAFPLRSKRGGGRREPMVDGLPWRSGSRSPASSTRTATPSSARFAAAPRAATSGPGATRCSRWPTSRPPSACAPTTSGLPRDARGRLHRGRRVPLPRLRAGARSRRGRRSSRHRRSSSSTPPMRGAGSTASARPLRTST